MKKLLIAILVLLPMITNCQIKVYDSEYFNDCQYDNFAVSAKEEAAWADTSITLIDFINQNITQTKITSKTNGKILLTIFISENGEPCAESFTNMTNNNKIRPIAFKEMVNKMPRWIPANNNGQTVNIMHDLYLKIENGRIVE